MAGHLATPSGAGRASRAKQRATGRDGQTLGDATRKAVRAGGPCSACVTDSAPSMTFAYVGYIWAILLCSFLTLFVGGIGLALVLIGRRAERRRPRITTVESLSIVREPATAPSAPPTDDVV